VAELKQEITNLRRAAHAPSVPSKEAIEQAVARALKEQEVGFKRREEEIIRGQGKLAALVSKFTENAKDLLEVSTVSVHPPQMTPLARVRTGHGYSLMHPIPNQGPSVI
jgi:hypothetical protein